MQAQSIPWGPIRSTLTEKFTFGDIKQLVGYGDLDICLGSRTLNKNRRTEHRSRSS